MLSNNKLQKDSNCVTAFVLTLQTCKNMMLVKDMHVYWV